MQSADFTAQPRPQAKAKKGGKKKKKVTQHSEAAEETVVGQDEVAATKDQAPNPLTPPKPSNGSDHHSTSGSRSGRKPTAAKPSASRVESTVGQRGEFATDASQLGSKRAGMSRVMRMNEGGLTATKLGNIRMWIDNGDHTELVDPQDVFSHERKMRRKMLKDCNNISSGGEGSSFQDQNGLSNMTTQYSNASRF